MAWPLSRKLLEIAGLTGMVEHLEQALTGRHYETPLGPHTHHRIL